MTLLLVLVPPLPYDWAGRPPSALFQMRNLRCIVPSLSLPRPLANPVLEFGSVLRRLGSGFPPFPPPPGSPALLACSMLAHVPRGRRRQTDARRTDLDRGAAWLLAAGCICNLTADPSLGTSQRNAASGAASGVGGVGRQASGVGVSGSWIVALVMVKVMVFCTVPVPVPSNTCPNELHKYLPHANGDNCMCKFPAKTPSPLTKIPNNRGNSYHSPNLLAGSVSDSDSFLPSVVFRTANHRDVKATCCQPATATATATASLAAALLPKEELALNPRSRNTRNHTSYSNLYKDE
jgi:hypothetical protein